MQRFDVIVAGGGAMGSAAAWQLARRGMRIAVFDSFAPPHALGSSHGATRIIREAYYEHPMYVPLVRRAFELWGDLARETDIAPLYTETGGVYVGKRDSALVQGVLASARRHAIAHEVLSPTQLAARWPALRAASGMLAVVEKRAGFLRVEDAIRAMRRRAAEHGARFFDEDPVQSFDVASNEIVARTSRAAYRARQLVVAVGAWIRELLPSLEPYFSVQRQVTAWFAPTHAALTPGSAPISMWELESGETFYTLPDAGDGFKIGVHYGGALVRADTVDRSVAVAEVARARELLARYIPGAAGALRHAAVCLYTNTLDLHFVLDWLPNAAGRLLVVSACSGHGFKFAPAIGEVAADLLGGSASSPCRDVAPFSLARFAST